AIDCANAAVRLGADTVTLAYRRDAASMPAFAHEVELAAESGVRFEWHTVVTRVLTRGRRITGVRCHRVRPQGRGRRARLVKVPRSEFTIPCDMVIKALGQQPLADLLRSIPKLKLTSDGRVAVDPETYATSVPRLFAGGDCRHDAFEEVVSAVEDGKRAAAAIDAMLSN
ncbi:MAG: NAD(P)-dependent oxidoreductase, partial [Planctomycetota bacterium]